MGSAPSWTDGRAWPRTTGIGARLRTSSQVAAVTSAALALAVGALAVWLSIAPFGARLSALVRMSAGDPIARVAGAADGAWAFVGSHYDGIYFFTIGIDPIAKGTAHTLIDQAAYRYGHPAYAELPAPGGPDRRPKTAFLRSACPVLGGVAPCRM